MFFRITRFWMITKKAGYHPALPLLVLVASGEQHFNVLPRFSNRPALHGTSEQIDS